MSHNYSVTIGPDTLSDIVQASYFAKEGDSGSPICYYCSDFRPMLVGLQSFIGTDNNGTFKFSGFCKIFNTLNSVGAAPYL